MASAWGRTMDNTVVAAGGKLSYGKWTYAHHNFFLNNFPKTNILLAVWEFLMFGHQIIEFTTFNMLKKTNFWLCNMVCLWSTDIFCSRFLYVINNDFMSVTQTVKCPKGDIQYYVQYSPCCFQSDHFWHICSLYLVG